ncbi:MAG: hypothetical protein M5U13_12250 [Thermoanaerobaculia bacterium]|nr:hypothetical protein [Thermoanaerobaculia bacterium]
MSGRGAPLLALVLLLAVGCGGGEAPVADLAARPTEVLLAYPEFRDVEVRFVPRVPLAELGERPSVFVHLLELPGSVVRTFDYPVPATWQVAEPAVDAVRLHQSALAPPLPEGEYQLTVGLYDAATGVRFPLAGGRGEADENEYVVATVRVPASAGPLPRFEYSPEWLETEGSPDRQIVATRWLGAAAGSVRVSQLAAGGVLHAQLYVPPGPEPGAHFAVVPDERGPVAVLRSTCSPEELVLSGAGRHWLEWRVPEGAEVCDLDFGVNFLFVGGRGEQRRSVRLEVLAWQPPSAAGR